MKIPFEWVQRLKESMPPQPDNGQVELRSLTMEGQVVLVAFMYVFGDWIVLNRPSE